MATLLNLIFFNNRNNEVEVVEFTQEVCLKTVAGKFYKSAI